MKHLIASCGHHRTWRTEVILRVLQRRGRPPAEIDLVERRQAGGVADLGAVEAEAEPGDGEDGDGDVAGEEVRDAKAPQEGAEAVEEDDEDEEEDADVGHVGLAPSAERQVAAVDALGVQRALEAHIAAADAGPGDQ